MGFSLRDGKTAALFPLDEISSEVFAVDAAGNSIDLGGTQPPDTVITIPDVVDSFTGRGREFGVDIGLQGGEDVADSLRLTRDVTVRALLSFRNDNFINGQNGTLVARGRRGSAAERLLFGVELERVDAANIRLLARWEEIGGGAATVVGATFPWPGVDEFFAVAVSRRWIDTTTVDVRYFVNEVEIGRETVVEGDIGEGVGGTLMIGCVGDAVGGFELFLPTDSVVDQVSIESDAMSLEEFRADFREITVHQPDGYRRLRSYIPPGDTWSDDPSSRIQRWIASEGDGIGFALSQGERLREDHLPDRAYGAALEAWESLVGIAVRGTESIEERRDAVIAALRKVLGYTIDALKTALEPLFGLDSGDIEIIEFSGLREDDFSFDDITPATPSNLWRDLPGVGTLAIAVGLCSIAVPGGSPNAQFPGDPTGSGGAPHRETSLTGGIGEDPDLAAIVIDVDATSGTTGLDVLCGVFMRNVAGEAVFFGVLDDGGGYELNSYSIVGGVRSALTSHGAGGAGVDRVLLRSLGGGLYEVATISGGVPTILSSTVAGPLAPRWAGFGNISRDVASNAQDADFDDAQIFEPKSPRGFAFISYRDPGLGGTFNLEKAQAQLDKQEPAHTFGLAVDTDPHFFELGDGGRLGIGLLMPRYP